MVIPLAGTWSLVAMTYVDPEGHEVAPWGLQPIGRITYTEDGRFSAVLASRSREMPHPSTTAPIEAQAAAFRKSSAYCGTYELDGDVMFHYVEVAVDPTWQDTIQERQVTYDGRYLRLTTQPVVTRRDPAGHALTLTWEKLAPAE